MGDPKPEFIIRGREQPVAAVVERRLEAAFRRALPDEIQYPADRPAGVTALLWQHVVPNIENLPGAGVPLAEEAKRLEVNRVARLEVRERPEAFVDSMLPGRRGTREKAFVVRAYGWKE